MKQPAHEKEGFPVDHTDGAPTGREPFPELLTAAPYVDWLVRVLLEAANEERSALRAARLPSAVTLPVTVVRHQCPHCRRTWAKKPAATAHVARCWSNPEVRSCKTCEHYEPGEPAGGCGGWDCNCPDTPEDCAVGAATPMITDCPLWRLADGTE
ncbi:hypothetical protein [Streptomyces sp. EKS3.2]|uniref:hypothetical protein n=1 Tax=Streptomyces sp. EKS3.2 TaxID=3461008 RepID=UPI004042F208